MVGLVEGAPGGHGAQGDLEGEQGGAGGEGAGAHEGGTEPPGGGGRGEGEGSAAAKPHGEGKVFGGRSDARPETRRGFVGGNGDVHQLAAEEGKGPRLANY